MGGRRFPQGAAPGWYVLPFQGSWSLRREAASRPPADQPRPASPDAHPQANPTAHSPQPRPARALPQISPSSRERTRLRRSDWP
jgi:hypothetical protein